MPDEIPIETLWRHRTWVREVAHALAGPGLDADDLEQEVWLRAIRRPPRHAASLRGWLGTVLRNTAANFRRGDARRRAREECGGARAAGTGEGDPVAEAEAHSRVVRAVLDLPEPYRTPLLPGAPSRRDRGPDRDAGRDRQEPARSRAGEAPIRPRLRRRGKRPRLLLPLSAEVRPGWTPLLAGTARSAGLSPAIPPGHSGNGQFDEWLPLARQGVLVVGCRAGKVVLPTKYRSLLPAGWEKKVAGRSGGVVTGRTADGMPVGLVFGRDDETLHAAIRTMTLPPE